MEVRLYCKYEWNDY